MGDIPIALDAKDLPTLVNQLMMIFRDIYEDNLGGTPLSGLTANKLLKASSTGNIASADADDFVAGTAYQITVTDDGDGTITLSTPQQLHTSANVQFGTVNKVTLTAPATAATFTLANGKTLTVSNTVTLTASDGATLAIGTGGALGSAAYTAAGAYEASGNVAAHAALTIGIHGAGAGTVLVSGNIGSTVQAYSANTAFRTDKLSAFAATTSAELAGVVSDETGTGALVLGTSPFFSTSITRVFGTTGGVVSLAAEATVDITAAHTITIQTNVPSGARTLGCQLRVDAALAAGETWNAQYATGSTQSICTAQAVAQNTKVNKFFDVNAATDIMSAETDITIQRSSNPGVDVFTAQGTIRAIVYYEAFVAMASV